MTTEREEALELAREAGLETRTLNSIDPDEIVVDQGIITDEIERLFRLAKQRGAEEQKRKDVEIIRGLTHKLAEHLYGHPREKAVEWAKEEKYDSCADRADEILDLIVLSLLKKAKEML